jgi:general transcription factor 3C polypeptide 3 (transcription factor C subunit 4)
LLLSVSVEISVELISVTDEVMDSTHYPDGIPLDEEMQEESAYPDPPQHDPNNPSFDVGNILASVIDPRLFGEQAYPQSINQYPGPPHESGGAINDENENEAEANDLYPEDHDDHGYPPSLYPPMPGDEASSDEDFVMSGDESERYVCHDTLENRLMLTICK